MSENFDAAATEEMGLFDTYGVDADNLEEISTGIPAGTYQAKILKAEIVRGTKKDDTAINMVITYQPDGMSATVREFFSLPKRKAPWDDVTVIKKNAFDGSNVTEKSHNEYLLSLLKTRLLALGVPEKSVNGVRPSQLVGAPVILTLVKSRDGEYTNVKRGRDGARKPGEAMDALPGTTQGMGEAFSPVATANPATPAQPAAGFVPAW